MIKVSVETQKTFELRLTIHSFIHSLGLDTTGDDIKLRKQVFGSNKLTEITSKSFHSLIFEALQEKTMVMLEICALVSLALSFYHPSNESSDDQSKSSGFWIFFSHCNIIQTTSINERERETFSFFLIYIR